MIKIKKIIERMKAFDKETELESKLKKLIEKVDKAIEKVVAIGIKKWLFWDIMVWLFELVYCRVDIRSFGPKNIADILFLALFCYSPIIQAKLNIFTGANEKMVGWRAWEKYGILGVGVPMFVIGCVTFVLLLIRRDIYLAILVFQGPPLLYSCCKAVVLYKEREKEPPLWS